MKTYTVVIETSNGKLSYNYESKINEIVNVMWNGEFQCVAKNGREIKGHYKSMGNREVPGR